MPYLAVDTATQTLTIAVGERGRLLGEASLVVKKNHSNRLMPIIESLLADLEIEAKDLKGIVAGHGPGSYTGVRIGVTTAKMMAWALQIPLAGVSSLDGLAYHYQTSDLLVCPMFDARRQQAYCALYERLAVGDGESFGKAEPDALRKLESLYSLIDEYLERRRREGRREQVVFLGDGAEAYHGLIEARFGKQAVIPESGAERLVRAAYLLDAGIALVESGQSAAAESFVPEYLQLVEAEAKLLQRKGSQRAVQNERNFFSVNESDRY